MIKIFSHARWCRFAAWFLAISYGLGAPLTAFLEYRSQTLSERFDLPAGLIYPACVVQMLCSVGILVRRFAPWAALLLSVVTIGAIVCHVRIGSPETAVAAVVYNGIQIWFGLGTRNQATPV